jgi:cell division protein FtsN
MASRKRRSSDQAPRWAFMLFGLSIGLAVALVVYLVSGNPDNRLDDPAAAATERPASGSSATPRAARNAEPPPAGSDESEEEFSFFRTLPESEVVVPGSGSPERGSAGPAQEYIIQAGSYSNFADADRGQAQLALLGIESKVERAIVGNEIRHRVIIGPLTDRDEIANTVRRLNAADIDSMPPRPVDN